VSNVFVSHSPRDNALGTLFIDEILHLALNLPVDVNIGRTPQAAGGLSEQNAITFIEGDLPDQALTIVLLSQNYYNDPACLCEMGALWARSAAVFFLLIPPLAHNDVTAVFADRHIDTITDVHAYENLKKFIESHLGGRSRTVKFHDQVQKFLNVLADLPSNPGHPDYVSYDTYKNLEEELQDYRSEHQRYAAIIRNQKNKIKRLVTLKGPEARKEQAPRDGSQE
jgi:hypothetical protein